MRLYKRGSIWWVYDKAIPQSHRRSLDTTNKKLAQQKADALVLSYYQKKLCIIEQVDRERIPIPIFKNKIKKYIQARYCARTVETYLMRLENLLKWLKIYRAMYKYVDEIQKIDIIDFITHRRKKISARTANNDITTLKTLFYKGIKLQLLVENPVVGVDELPCDSKPKHYFKPDEIELLFQYIPARFQPHFMTLLYTGIRKGELMNLEWDDIHLKEKYIYVKPHNDRTTRKMKPRIIPMHDNVIEAIRIRKELNESDQLIFSGRKGKMLPKNTLYEIFIRAKNKAGVKKGNLHSLRHSFATHLLRKGISIKVVKELLGHEKIETTEIYTHLDVNEFRPLLNISLNFNINIHYN